MKNKIILVCIGIIIAASMVSTIWYVYKNSPQSTGLNTDVTVDAKYVGEVKKIEKVIKDYYDVYEKTTNTNKRTDEGKKIVESGVYEIYNQENRITNKFIDTQKAIKVLNSDPDEIGLGYNHITCSQDDVYISKIDVVEVVPVANASPMTLRALARVLFVNGGSFEDTGYHAEVGLVQQNDGKWLIDAIECKDTINLEILSQLQKLPEIKSLISDRGSFEITDFIRSDISATTSLVLAGGRDSAFYNDTSYVYKVSKNGGNVSINSIPLVGTQNGIKEYSEFDSDSIYWNESIYNSPLTTAYFEGRKLKILGMRPFRTYPCNLIRTFEYYNDRMIETSIGQVDFCKKYKIDVPEDMDKIPESVVDNSVVKEMYTISPETLQKALKFNGLNPKSKMNSDSASVYVPSANDEIIATSGDWSVILKIEGQIGGALLVQRDSKGVQKIIAVDEDINYMIEKFVPADVAQNLKTILQDRAVNSAKNREANKNTQGIVKDKNIKTLPVFKLTHIEASEEITNSAMDYPRTKVQIQYGSKIYDLKTYIGYFTNGDKGNWTKLTGEVAGIVSWYGGAGDELRIIDKGDRYVVMHKEMDAENGYESEYIEVKVLEGK